MEPFLNNEYRNQNLNCSYCWKIVIRSVIYVLIRNVTRSFMSTVQPVSLINVSNVKKACRQDGNYVIHLPEEKEENPQ